MNDIRPEKVRYVDEPIPDDPKQRCNKHACYYYSTCPQCVQESILLRLEKLLTLAESENGKSDA